jgi:hypothetical protein
MNSTDAYAAERGYLRADGTPMTWEERRSKDERDRIARETAAARARNVATKPETKDEQLARLYKEKIRDLRQQMRVAAPGDLPDLQRHAMLYEDSLEGVETKMANEARLEKFANNPDVARARTCADAIERSWRAIYPGLTDEDEQSIHNVVALARAEEWNDPCECATAFWQSLAVIEQRSLDYERAAQGEREYAALKHNADLEQSRLNLAQQEQRANEVRQRAEGKDVP